MTDHDIFDLLAADAPVPSPDHAETIHRLARRARTRRRVAGLTAAGGVAAVCIGVAVLTAAHQPPAVVPPGASPQITAVSPALDDQAQAYATAIQTLAEQVRGSGPKIAVLYIVDHTCTNVLDPTDRNCAPQPLPESLRMQLTTALAAYAPVTFVADGSDITDAHLNVINNGVAVTLAPLRRDGGNMFVPLSVRRGGLNGQGLTYQLARSGSAWRVTGTVGPGWIS